MLHATKYRLFIRRGALLQAKRLSSTTPNTKNSPPPLYRNQPDVGENQPENKEKEDDSKKEKDANAFISSLFSNPPNRTWFSKLAWPELPSVETLNKKMEELYPQFTSQFEQIREGYEHMWQFLTMEDFRKIMDEIKRDEKDPMKHPEVAKDAYVRENNTLSDEEMEFLGKKRKLQKVAFANYIGEHPNNIDERDIPVVGIASSGGGYRAMIGLTGYLNAMKKTGALDCVTYLSGISGSCWTMSLYYNHLSNNDPSKLQHHFERQLGTHWANMTQFFNVLNTSHHHAKVVLQGAIQRFEQRQGDMSLVDIFGMLMGGTLLTTKKMTEHLERNKNNVPNVLDEQDMYLSHQAEFIKDAKEPLPIYCVVRHEVGDMVKKDQLGDIYQWFEFTPFEMGCEEMEAWIPIWGFGRKFENGKSQERLPEQTLDILMGMFGSAFAASLVHFYQEIRGFLPDGSIDKLDDAVSQYEKSMSSYHPISPSSFPNPFYKIAANHHDIQRPESLVESENIYLMDAGMDNNIPFYPLLRKGRDVDVIIAIDISADIQTAPHFSRAESYMKRRGIEGWPTGAGWPKEKVTVTKEVEPKKEEQILKQFKKAASWTNIESILSKKKQEKAKETQLQKRKITQEYPLGSCTIFSGESTEQDDGGSKRKKKNVTLAYFPFIVNKSYDPDFDPQVEEFCATWNFVYTPEQVKKVAGLAEANWTDNQDKIKEVLRETWEKKRRERRGY